MITVRTTVDPARQPYLDHHRLHRVPVLPGVVGLEAFARAAMLIAPGWHVAAVERVNFHVPVRFYRDRPRTLTVVVAARTEGGDLVANCRLESTPAGADADPAAGARPPVHFTGTVRLTRRPPALEPRVAPVAAAVPALSPEDVYRLYFHGPAYRVVSSAWRRGPGAAAAYAVDLPPHHEPPDLPTLIEPRLVELCFQAAGLWQAAAAGRLALPRYVHRVTVPATRPAPDAALVAVVRPGPSGFAGMVLDGDGRVVLRVDGYRTVPLPAPLTDEVRGPLRAVLGA